MRSYVFTEKERKAIRGFMDGSVPRDNPVLMVVLSRVKSFKDLAADVDLYVRVRKTVSTVPA
jgi:hypothetical protein